MSNRLYLLLILSLNLMSDIRAGDTLNDNRYTFIQSLLNQYKRPFTILDIGAALGHISLQVARDYDAVCVMIEANNPPAYPHSGDELLTMCKAHSDLKNIIMLDKLFTPNELQHLSECEHFDVVLALNVIHEFGEQWQEAVDVIAHMGDHVVVEVPSDYSEIENYIIAKRGHVLGVVPDTGSTLYIIELPHEYLRRKSWLRLVMKENIYRIESSFTYKVLSKPVSYPKKSFQTTIWLPGINLVTFKMCHDVYPTKEMLCKSLSCISDPAHSDWFINNMILQGDKLITIDGNDVACRAFCSDALFQAHQELLNLEDPQQIEHYFWQKLVKVPVCGRQEVKFFGQLFPPSALIFDIGSYDPVQIDRYLSYGAKVIYWDADEKKPHELFKQFRQEAFLVADHTLLTQKKESAAAIDRMIIQFGVPQFCTIHQPVGSVYEVLQTLSQPISCIAFKFDIHFQSDYIACLRHLALLGYTEFNFSVRDIQGLVLEPNIYIDTHKKWVCSVEELLDEINEFSKLDYDSEHLWGFIYAKCFMPKH